MSFMETQRNKLIILDDVKWVTDWVKNTIEKLPQARHLEFLCFTKDDDAKAYVIHNRLSVLGYIQDINREPNIGVTPLHGIRFYNEVIDTQTPWAKTIFHSGQHDTRVIVDLFEFGGSKIEYLVKGSSPEELIEKFDWLIIPYHETEKREPDKIVGKYDIEEQQLIELLPIPWEDLCNYLTRHPEYLYQMSPRQFEGLAAEIFRSHGWDVDFTARTRDGGFDIIAIRRNFPTDLRVLVEAKRYAPNNPVGVQIVRSLYGTRIIQRASQVVLVTSSFVTKYAKREFENAIPWELDFIERDKILEWCQAYKIGSINGVFNNFSE